MQVATGQGPPPQWQAGEPIKVITEDKSHYREVAEISWFQLEIAVWQKKGKKHKERLRMLEGGHVWWGKYAVQTFFFLPPPQVSKTISGNPWNEIWVVADRGMAVVSQCWSLAVLSLLDDKNTLAACARFCRFIICPDSLLAWCTEHFCARTQHRMCAQTSNANTTRPRPLVVQGHINPLDFCRQSRALTTYMGLWLWSVQTDYQLWFLWEMAFHRIGTKKSPTTST